MFILLISNHTVFLVQFGINLHLWVFQKRNCTRRSGSCNFSFLKNSLVQINSKLNSKPYQWLPILNLFLTKPDWLWWIISGRTFFILLAMALEAIFVSTFIKEIGRQFSRYVLSLPFLYKRVIIAYFASWISPHNQKKRWRHR